MGEIKQGYLKEPQNIVMPHGKIIRSSGLIRFLKNYTTPSWIQRIEKPFALEVGGNEFFFGGELDHDSGIKFHLGTWIPFEAYLAEANTIEVEGAKIEIPKDSRIRFEKDGKVREGKTSGPFEFHIRGKKYSFDKEFYFSYDKYGKASLSQSIVAEDSSFLKKSGTYVLKKKGEIVFFDSKGYIR
jgi:hypothetical protein